MYSIKQYINILKNFFYIINLWVFYTIKPNICAGLAKLD